MTKSKIWGFAAFFAVSLIAGQAGAREAITLARLPETTSALPVGEARPVWGWVDYCRRNPTECDGARTQAREIRLDARTWQTLVEVNRSVNSAIDPITDEEHWGVADRWDIPTDGKGDCEDYVLLKRKVLTERGFPRSSLLVTVVIDTKGAGHAVLTVKTDHGDFVLDNMRDDILAWVKTGYRFVKRQSQEEQNRWVALDDGVQIPATASAR